MSAENWAVCPGCAKRREEYETKESAKVDASYGVVSVEEFDRMRAELSELRSIPVGHTFREDYVIYGAAEGEVVVNYSGKCMECTAWLKFEYTQKINYGE